MSQPILMPIIAKEMRQEFLKRIDNMLDVHVHPSVKYGITTINPGEKPGVITIGTRIDNDFFAVDIPWYFNLETQILDVDWRPILTMLKEKAAQGISVSLDEYRFEGRIATESHDITGYLINASEDDVTWHPSRLFMDNGMDRVIGRSAAAVDLRIGDNESSPSFIRLTPDNWMFI